MCGLIDETVLSMPWGLESIWSKESLLITFHKEYSAGERFFALLKKRLEQPRSNIDVLEFFYVCLCLGFQGRYRMLERGGEELARVKQDVYQIIRRERGEPERSCRRTGAAWPTGGRALALRAALGVPGGRRGNRPRHLLRAIDPAERGSRTASSPS